MLMDEYTYKVSTELVYTIFAVYVIIIWYIKKNSE
jgi:hypothetical protein